MPRPLLPIAVAVLALLPSTAAAADSHAPKGARGDWLPSSEWVMSAWMPFDEARLYELLDTDRAQMAIWLNDRRTLGEFAATRGFRDRRALARTLVAPRVRGASAATTRRLRGRALDMLTQAHLARHVMFHIFHTPAIPRHAQDIFGMSPQRYRRLRDSGWSPQRIAARGGKTLTQSHAALRTVLRRRDGQGVRARAMSAGQAAALFGHQDSGLSTYMTRHYRTPAQQEAFCRLR